ncbi:hypothetical protein [Arthrobacter sp. MMS18-M83]|uniref:hypothetical protein n=1 Tax=Arthrobacter sp. MMS18-M83 TaxID=2996261 RepID=UPI00227BB785|nr:hypothetical protein [Arthrobacter sp. MMS18-M83]WAH96166.1 hypothetical protein OW521_17315 [Arthrobacter sp. MMS18-M83]
MMVGGAERDVRQTRVLEALRSSRSAKLAGIYHAAIETLAVAPVSGFELARVSVICHCVRELMNGVPSAMSGIDIPRPDPNSDALKNRLPDLLKKVDLAVDDDQESVPVPNKAAKTLDELIKSVAQEQGRNRRLAIAFITDGSDDKHPAIRQWMSAQRFFARWTHLDRKEDGDRDAPTDVVILANLRIVEDVIETRAGLFFANLDAIEDILAAANAADAGGEA